ncbi:MAG TPA: M56 family metallopeptidase [Verrucomicrobiales bacterium]|nr:M56 family metallopeptidase [Verrucomicrobiales bacterium]
MNRLSITSAALLSAAMPLVFDSALKGLTLLLAAALTALFLWRASASARHLVWLVAIVALLVVPALSVVLPQWRVLPEWAVVQAGDGKDVKDLIEGIRVPEAWPVEKSPHSEMPRPQAAQAPYSSHPSPPGPAASVSPVVPAVEPPQAVPPEAQRGGWLAPAWAGGCALLLVRLLVAHWLLRRTSRSRVGVESGPLAIALAEAADQLKLKRGVKLLLDTRRTIPVVWGVFRPRLMLPAEAETWDREQLRSVLLHELAHIRRRDPEVQWLTQCACALHWFNPLVWLAAWRLHVERERACDDLVLASGVRASDYANHLLHVATELSPARWTAACGLAMAKKSRLEGRLLAVLSDKLNRRRVNAALAAVALVLGIGAAVPLAMLRAGEKEKEEKAAEVSAKTEEADVKPKDTTAAVLLARWQALEGKGPTVPETAVFRMREAIEKWINQPPAKAEAARVRALRDRDANLKEHKVSDVAAWLDEIAAINRGPIEFAINGETRAGRKLDQEGDASLKFGPVAENGLRAAWKRHPVKDTYVVGDVIYNTLVLQNTTDRVLEFKCPYSLQGIPWDITAGGRKVEMDETILTGSIPIFGWKLQPGEAAEIGGYGVSIGKAAEREGIRKGFVSTVMKVSGGERVSASWRLRDPAPMTTGNVEFDIVAEKDVAVWQTSRAGKWPLPGGATLEVAQEVIHGADVTSSAVLHWAETKEHPALRHEFGIASDAFGNREPWVMAWEKDTSVLWIAIGKWRSYSQPRVPKHETAGIRCLDFSNPESVSETGWQPEAAPLPDKVRTALAESFNLPAQREERENQPPRRESTLLEHEWVVKARTLDVSGKPLGNVPFQLTLAGSNDPPFDYGRSNEDGWFWTSVRPPLTALKDGFRVLVAGQRSPSVQVPAGFKEFELKVGSAEVVEFARGVKSTEGVTFFGLLLDINGRPVPGALVAVRPASALTSGLTTQTDAEGKFTLPGVPAGVPVCIHAGYSKWDHRGALDDITFKAGMNRSAKLLLSAPERGFEWKVGISETVDTAQAKAPAEAKPKDVSAGSLEGSTDSVPVPETARAPDVFQISAAKQSAIAIQTDKDVNFVLYHPGFLSRGFSRSESTDGNTRRWKIQGVVQIKDVSVPGSDRIKREFKVLYSSDDPNTLFLDDKAYVLNQPIEATLKGAIGMSGRIFILQEKGDPIQTDRTLSVRNEKDLETIGEFAKRDLEERETYGANRTVQKMEGWLLAWDVQHPIQHGDGQRLARLRIFPDGRVLWMPDHRSVHEFKMSPEGIAGLTTSLVSERHVPEWKPQKVKFGDRELEMEPATNVWDAYTNILKFRHDGKMHGIVVSSGPSNPEGPAFDDINKGLLKAVYLAMAGGGEGLKRYTDIAEAALKKNAPEAAQKIGEREFSSAGFNSDGSLMLRFEFGAGGPGVGWPQGEITLQAPKTGTAFVSHLQVWTTDSQKTESKFEAPGVLKSINRESVKPKGQSGSTELAEDLLQNRIRGIFEGATPLQSSALRNLVYQEYESFAAELEPQVQEAYVRRRQLYPPGFMVNGKDAGEYLRQAAILEVMEKRFVKPDPVTETDKEDWLRRHPEFRRNSDKVNLWSITIPGGQPGENSETQKALADDIRAQLVKGADFEMLARAHSADSRRGTGGRWGLVEESDLSETFWPVVSKIPAGTVSDVIAMAGSFYIFKVDAREEGKLRAADEINTIAETNVSWEKRKQACDKWVAGLQRAAKQLPNVAYGTGPVTPLMAASVAGDLEKVKSLLAAGENPNVRTGDKNPSGAIVGGVTSLFLACEKGHYEVAKALIEGGAKVELAKTANKRFPLFETLAAAKDEAAAEKLMTLLLDHGADANEREGHIGSALHLAATRDWRNVMQLLVSHGASKDAKAPGGQTPAELARQQGKAGAAEYLESLGKEKPPESDKNPHVRKRDDWSADFLTLAKAVAQARKVPEAKPDDLIAWGPEDGEGIRSGLLMAPAVQEGGQLPVMLVLRNLSSQPHQFNMVWSWNATKAVAVDQDGKPIKVSNLELFGVDAIHKVTLKPNEQVEMPGPPVKFGVPAREGMAAHVQTSSGKVRVHFDLTNLPGPPTGEVVILVTAPGGPDKEGAPATPGAPPEQGKPGTAEPLKNENTADGDKTAKAKRPRVRKRDDWTPEFLSLAKAVAESRGLPDARPDDVISWGPESSEGIRSGLLMARHVNEGGQLPVMLVLRNLSSQPRQFDMVWSWNAIKAVALDQDGKPLQVSNLDLDGSDAIHPVTLKPGEQIEMPGPPVKFGGPRPEGLAAHAKMAAGKVRVHFDLTNLPGPETGEVIVRVTAEGAAEQPESVPVPPR